MLDGGININKSTRDYWIWGQMIEKELINELKLKMECVGCTFGSEAVVLIVSKTLSKLLPTSSSVFPSINRSWPFGSVKELDKRNARYRIAYILIVEKKCHVDWGNVEIKNQQWKHREF